MPKPETSILTANTSVSAALTEAQRIIAAAEKRAEELLAKAQIEATALADEGYRAGYVQGQKDATSQALRLIQSQSNFVEQISHESAKLGLELAKKILDELPDSAGLLIRKLAKQAVLESGISGRLTFSAHPKDLKNLQSMRDELTKLAGGTVPEFVSDDTIPRGGCILRTDFGEVDARVDSLLELLKEKLGLG